MAYAHAVPSGVPQRPKGLEKLLPPPSYCREGSRSHEQPATTATPAKQEKPNLAHPPACSCSITIGDGDSRRVAGAIRTDERCQTESGAVYHRRRVT